MKFIKMSVDFDSRHKLANYLLGLYYSRDMGDINYSRAILHFTIAAKELCVDSIRRLIDMEPTTIEQFLAIESLLQITSKLNNPIITELIVDKIKSLRCVRDVVLFINKRRLSEKYKMVESCTICYETSQCLPMNCCHFYCEKCFCKVQQCSLCRFD